MKTLTTLLFIFFITIAANAQSTDAMAKILFFEAQEFHGQQKYNESNTKLTEIQQLLGKNNLTIQRLRVKNYYALNDIVRTKQEIVTYMNLNPDVEGEGMQEVMKIKMAIDEAERIAKETKERENTLWSKAVQTNKKADYDAYLKEFPNGTNSKKANERSFYLEFFSNIDEKTVYNKMLQPSYSKLSLDERYQILLYYLSIDSAESFAILWNNDTALLNFAFPNKVDELLAISIDKKRYYVFTMFVNKGLHTYVNNTVLNKADQYYYSLINRNNIEHYKSYLSVFPRGQYAVEATNYIKTVQQKEAADKRAKYNDLMSQAAYWQKKGNKAANLPFYFLLGAAASAGLIYIADEDEDMETLRTVGVVGTIGCGTICLITLFANNADYYYRRANEKRKQAQQYLSISPAMFYQNQQSSYGLTLSYVF
jgi:hypothetical protein